ncbi:hypothetical protein V6N13_111721 [Hibiscus sabdariffa]|uniref:Uncharacterized protein n=1 Tax=Hibiscus sabdariffa TaxID=183260 RepID=A0ABR2TL48_9ROSI
MKSKNESGTETRRLTRRMRRRERASSTTFHLITGRMPFILARDLDDLDDEEEEALASSKGPERTDGVPREACLSEEEDATVSNEMVQNHRHKRGLAIGIAAGDTDD